MACLMLIASFAWSAGTDYLNINNLTWNLVGTHYESSFKVSAELFNDNFEQYTNLTPMVDGINGWYSSSYSINGTNYVSIVQTNIICPETGGIKSVMIPVDCTLSNRFTGISTTNVWIQMDVRLSFYDSTNTPVVDTNVVMMFYVNTNGYFVVHNGTSDPDPTNSVNWVTVTNSIQISTIGTNWVTIGIYEDFAKTNWDLYAKTNWDLPAAWVLVTNNIGFVNPTLTNFSGFNEVNGSATSYLDNVYVINTNAGPII